MLPLLARVRAALRLFISFTWAFYHCRKTLWQNLDLPGALSLDNREKGRLRHYFYGVTYLACLMGHFQSHFRNKRERFLFDHLTALAFFFDDLSEKFEAAEPTVWHDNVETYGALADQRGLSLYLLQRVYRHLPAERQSLFRQYMHQVFNLEANERQRKTGSAEKASTLETLRSVTTEKGGASVLLFRSVLDAPLASPEEEAFYQFGALIQLSDDIFDLWHDRRDGIETVATFLAEKDRIPELRAIFEAQKRRCHAAFRNTPAGNAAVESSLHIIHYLVSITRVCLNHYSRLERDWGRLPLENRTAIVVDMGKWINQLRAVRELLRRVE